MSADTMSSTPSPRGFARGLLATLALTAVALVGGAILAVAVTRLIPEASSDRLVKVARRCMLLTAALFVPVYLNWIRFRGRADLGWRAPPGTATTGLGRGFALGLATLLPLFLLSLLLGSREWNTAYTGWTLAGKLLAYLLSALVVGVTEETMARGLLFLPLRRLMGPGSAALLSSLVFAWAHFLEPTANALLHPGWGLAVFDTLSTALRNFQDEPYAWARLANLALMSLVLCMAVVRTGSIWLAAGLHAGWVMVKKANAVLADSVHDSALRSWAGARSDHLDSWGCTLCLALLLVALARWRRPQSSSAS